MNICASGTLCRPSESEYGCYAATEFDQIDTTCLVDGQWPPTVPSTTLAPSPATTTKTSTQKTSTKTSMKTTTPSLSPTIPKIPISIPTFDISYTLLWQAKSFFVVRITMSTCRDLSYGYSLSWVAPDRQFVIQSKGANVTQHFTDSGNIIRAQDFGDEVGMDGWVTFYIQCNYTIALTLDVSQFTLTIGDPLEQNILNNPKISIGVSSSYQSQSNSAQSAFLSSNALTSSSSSSSFNVATKGTKLSYTTNSNSISFGFIGFGAAIGLMISVGLIWSVTTRHGLKEKFMTKAKLKTSSTAYNDPISNRIADIESERKDQSNHNSIHSNNSNNRSSREGSIKSIRTSSSSNDSEMFEEEDSNPPSPAVSYDHKTRRKYRKPKLRYEIELEDIAEDSKEFDENVIKILPT